MPQRLRVRSLLGRVAGFDFADDFAGAGFVVWGDKDFAGAIGKNCNAGFDVILAQGYHHQVGRVPRRLRCDFDDSVGRRFVFPVEVFIVDVRRRLVVLSRRLHVGIHFWIGGIVQSYLNDFLGPLEEFRRDADAVAVFDTLNDLLVVLNDLVRNLSFAQFGAIHHAVFLARTIPNLLQVCIGCSGGDGRRRGEFIDQINMAVGAGLKSGAVFGSALRAKHNGRRVYYSAQRLLIGGGATVLQINPLLAAGVFVSTAATDAVYVLFNAAVSARRRVPAATWSSVWYLLSAFAVISYTRNWMFIGFAAAGSWVGAYVSMTLLRKPEAAFGPKNV